MVASAGRWLSSAEVVGNWMASANSWMGSADSWMASAGRWVSSAVVVGNWMASADSWMGSAELWGHLLTVGCQILGIGWYLVPGIWQLLGV